MEEEKGTRRNIILIVVGIVAIALAGYRWWSTSNEEVVPEARSVSDFIVNWECLDCGNRTETHAGTGPRKCAKCGKDSAYAVITWACPTHGAKPLFFQYDAQGQPSQIRTKKTDWKPALTPEGGWNINCPDCGAAMFPAEAVRPAPEPAGSN